MEPLGGFQKTGLPAGPVTLPVLLGSGVPGLWPAWRWGGVPGRVGEVTPEELEPGGVTMGGPEPGGVLCHHMGHWEGVFGGVGVRGGGVGERGGGGGGGGGGEGEGDEEGERGGGWIATLRFAHWVQSSGSRENSLYEMSRLSIKVSSSWAVEGDQGQIVVRCDRERSGKLTLGLRSGGAGDGNGHGADG